MTLPFKDTSVDPKALNPLDILSRQNRVKKLSFFFLGSKLNDFLSIDKQITIISIIMQTQVKFCVCIT